MINGHQKREIERDMKDVLVVSYKIKLPVLRSYRVVFVLWALCYLPRRALTQTNSVSFRFSPELTT